MEYVIPTFLASRMNGICRYDHQLICINKNKFITSRLVTNNIQTWSLYNLVCMQTRASGRSDRIGKQGEENKSGR